MRKFTNFLAVVGAAVLVWAVVHAVWWGQVQMERTRQECIRWTMEWASRR